LVRTGDLGRVDEDGYFFIVDRKKDLIIRGGYNVYPREIEEVLYEHPDVAEAAVIGVPDPLLGEEVAAVVALRTAARVTVEELRAHVRARVAAYKYPRHLCSSTPCQRARPARSSSVKSSRPPS
jgi:long-chain acyl-CoA synthetase